MGESNCGLSRAAGARGYLPAAASAASGTGAPWAIDHLGAGGGDVGFGGGAHHLHANLRGGRDPGQVLGGAIERAQIQEDQLEGRPAVPQHAGHAQPGVLQLTAAEDEQRHQTRPGHRR
jgi:hypothetical protein